jgi:outer membrane lipoprotein SlyB
MQGEAMNNPSSPTTSPGATADPASFWRRSALVIGAVGLIAIGALAAVLWQRSVPPPAAATAEAPAVGAAPATPAPAVAATAGNAPPAEAARATAPAARTAAAPPHPTTAPAPAPVMAAATSNDPPSGSGTTAAPAPPSTPPAPAVCATCGVVKSVTAVTQKGEGSGVGAVAGAVVGGVIGHQFGGGAGKTAMTVLGAAGGGMAGNEVEKRQKSTTQYQVAVHMDDGAQRTFTLTQAPAVGDRVRVENNQLVLDKK